MVTPVSKAINAPLREVLQRRAQRLIANQQRLFKMAVLLGGSN